MGNPLKRKQSRKLELARKEHAVTVTEENSVVKEPEKEDKVSVNDQITDSVTQAVENTKNVKKKRTVQADSDVV